MIRFKANLFERFFLEPKGPVPAQARRVASGERRHGTSELRLKRIDIRVLRGVLMAMGVVLIALVATVAIGGTQFRLRNPVIEGFQGQQFRLRKPVIEGS